MAAQPDDVEREVEAMFPGLIREMTGVYRSIMESSARRDAGVREVDLVYRSSVEDFARSEADAGRLDCGPGCSACCSQLVELLESEVTGVVRAIRAIPVALRKSVLKKLRRQARLESATQDPEQYRHPCSLLGDDGRCLVYAARPTACRKAVSSNRMHCQRPQPVVFEENPSLVAAHHFAIAHEYARTAVLLDGSLPRPLAGAVLEHL